MDDTAHDGGGQGANPLPWRREPAHVIKCGWRERIRTTELYAYVSITPVTPLGPPEPAGDLLALHEDAGIQLRVLPNLCCGSHGTRSSRARSGSAASGRGTLRHAPDQPCP